jgi:hypothetical protein
MNGLTALNPLFLSLLPLAALPVLFHLFFRLKRRPRPFPTLMFFHRLDPKLNARRRLREWLILLLRTLLILFLLLALARPVWLGHGQAGGVAVVLLIDNSGSMSGQGEGGRTKLKQALDGARDLLAELRGTDSAGIVLLVPDPAAPLPPGLTPDKAALKLALDGIAETEAGGSVAAALDRAMRMLEGGSASIREIQVFTDLQQEKWGQIPLNPPAAPRGFGMVVHRVASPSSALPNVSLARLEMPARPVVAGRRFPVQVRLANADAVKADVRLNWLDDAGNRGSVEAAVQRQDETNVTVTLLAANPGLRWVLFSVDGDDFPADNRAAAAFVCVEQQSALFLGAPADFGYLPLALSPGGDGRLSGLAVSFSSFDSFAADNRAAFVVLPWNDILQADADASARLGALREFLTNGGTVLVTPPLGGLAAGGTKPDWLAVAPESLQGSSNGLALTVLDKAGAIFDDLRDDKGEVALRNVKVFRFLPLRLSAQAAPLLGLEDGSVVLAAENVGRGLLLACGLAFDPAWSTLPLKPAFVALAQGMALNHADAPESIASVVAGEPPAGMPAGADTLAVQSLGGSPLDWKGPAGQFTAFPRVGVYAMRAGRETNWVAVRSSEKEGRRKFITGGAVAALGNLPYSVDNMTGSAGARPDFRRQDRSLDLSLPLLLLAFASLALEGWLANPPALKPRPSAPPSFQHSSE